MADPTCVARLDGSADPIALGGKAAALDRLIAHGHPVPRSAVITTEAYRCVVGQGAVRNLIDLLRTRPERADVCHVDDDEIDRVFLDAPVPVAVRDDIATVARTLTGPFAVRSSATSEDLSSSAFPGQYRTVLGASPDGLERAVRLVWASLWHAAPRQYRSIRGVDDRELAMAVLVMEMVDATAAGVLFTRDPIGDDADVRLETVTGLGDALVSGAATPTAHTWLRATATDRARDELGSTIAELVGRSLDLERLLGGPQDIEFAIDGDDRLWLLQARPITTLGRPSLTRGGIAEMLPGVLPPLLQQTAGRQVEEGFRDLFGDLGGSPNVDARFVRFERSRAMLDLDVIRRATASIPGGSVAELERGYGLDPRSDTLAKRASAGQTLRVLQHRRTAVTEAQIVTQAVDRLVDDDLDGDRSAIDDDELLARWERVHDLGVRTASAEMAVAALATAAHRGVETTLEQHTDPAHAARLTQDLTRSRDIRDATLSRAFRRLPDPPPTARTDDWSVAALALDAEETGRAFLAAWTRALDRSGSRSVFGGPTWAGDPALAWLTCRTAPAGPPAERPDLGRELRRQSGSAMPGVSRIRRRFLAREAADAGALLVRRERTKQALLDLGGAAHRLTAEIGDRLTHRGVLSRSDDVWLLGPHELRRALVTGCCPDLVARRAAFEQDRRTAAATGTATSDRRGWPASAGRARGPARVVTAPRAGAIARGEILIAHNTDASWAPLFALAGGIVVEEGGPLSHAAILARELEVPAVVNLPGIVNRITTAGPGALVDVDGTTGEVSVSGDADADDLAATAVPVLHPPDDEQRVGVFVTGLIGASALLGLAVSVTEAVSSDRGIRRIDARARAPAALLADTVRHGTAIVPSRSAGLLPARRYRWVAVIAAFVAIAVAAAGIAGYVADRDNARVLWLAATGSGTLALALAAAGGWSAARRWPDVPPFVRRLTPSPPDHTTLRNFWSAMPPIHRRWLAVFGTIALVLLVLNLTVESWLRAVDERIYDAIGAGPDIEHWGPEWFGMYFGRPQVAIPFALLVALFTVRCRVLAVAYPLTIMFGGLVNLGLGALVGRDRPPFGAHADQTDSFPSGHAIEITLLLGLAPLAMAVLFRSQWVGRVVRTLATGVLVVMLADGLRDGSHWPSDHLGGFAIAMCAVVFVHALARMPELHRSCNDCPALAIGTDPVLQRYRPLLPLAPGVVRVLHRVSLIWAWFAVAALEIAGRAGWLDHRPGTETFEVTVRPLFLVLFAVGALLAWRWTIAGGLLATFTASGILVWEGQQLEPPHAIAVVVMFAVPGLAWLLLDLHERRPALALAGVALALVAGSIGFGVATKYYDDLFGPSHPDSVAMLPDDTRVEWIWVGAVTTDTATVVTEVGDDDEQWQAVVRDASGSIVADVEATSDGDGIVRFEMTGLSPDSEYAVEVIEAGRSAGSGIDEARFRTFPEGPQDLLIALGSCMRVGTNGAVFDAIGALDPNLFVIDGDFHYANIGDPDADAFRDVLDLNLSEPGPSTLYRSIPIAYVWDDHDYGGNNGDSTSPTRATALSVYRQYVPSYLASGPATDSDDPIFQAFDVGDVRMILTDVRSARTPAGRTDDADKTMLGVEQKAWLKAELLAARDTHALTVWVNPVPWIGEATPGGDAWNGYSTERAELADFIATNDIDRLLMLSGDAHMVAIDDGTNSGYASDGSPGFPILHAGALDRPGHMKGGPYSEGAVPGGGQFGVVEIEHRPDQHPGGIIVRLTGRDWTGATLLSYEFSVPAD